MATWGRLPLMVFIPHCAPKTYPLLKYTLPQRIFSGRLPPYSVRGIVWRMRFIAIYLIEEGPGKM